MVARRNIYRHRPAFGGAAVFRLAAGWGNRKPSTFAKFFAPKTKKELLP